MSSKDDNADVKLADFGLSTVVTNDSMLRTSCGTLTYCAPEVLRGESYGKAVDLWSIGVITYILLSGYPPFWDKDENVMMELTLKGAFAYFSPDWDEVSETAKDFISSLIQVDQSKRLDCDQALSHPWLALELVEKKNLVSRVGTNLVKHFNARQKLKSSVAAIKFVQAIQHVAKLSNMAQKQPAAAVPEPQGNSS
ncbi:hypothetical protein HDV03_003346 [Kappamyces sp. JEL0829]|nr:hypothetical protein HDV03_003346 [Kappamyces sp. JEL0829]KAJ3372165.1 hypothetical protein HDU91_004308 [Kappamyces sp. JEL0680]